MKSRAEVWEAPLPATTYGLPATTEDIGMIIGKLGVYGVISVKVSKAKWPGVEAIKSEAFRSAADANRRFNELTATRPANMLVYLVRVYSIGWEMTGNWYGAFAKLVCATAGEPKHPGITHGVNCVRSTVSEWADTPDITFVPSPWEDLVMHTERIAAEVHEEASKGATAQAYILGAALPPEDEPIAYPAFAGVARAEIAPAAVRAELVKEWECLGWDEESALASGEGVIVAVLDTGVNVAAPELKGRCLPLIDATGTDPSGTDKNGHGHFCSTEIAGLDLAKGFVGLIAKAVILPVRVLTAAGWGTDTMIARGIDAAVSAGAKVISMSLGGPGEMPLALAAVKRALAKNVVVVAAAGNDGPGRETMGYPGRYEEVISVGAVDSSGKLASFSSRGNPLDICGVGAKKLGITTAGRIEAWDGTSMACPTVSAAVGAYTELHQELHPNDPFPPQRPLLAMMDTARDIMGTGKDPDSGAGIIQFGAMLGTIRVPPPPPPPPAGGVEFKANSNTRYVLDGMSEVYKRVTAITDTGKLAVVSVSSKAA